jgi:hypothetical protein
MKRYLAMLLTAQLWIASLAACTPAPRVVDQLTAAAAPEEHEWAKELDAAGTVARRQIAVWTHCQSKFAITLARNTSESPEAITISAFAACRGKEDLVRVAILKKVATPDRADHFMDRLRQASRERVILEIVAGRNPRK